MNEYDSDIKRDGEVFDIIKRIERKKDRRGKGHSSALMVICKCELWYGRLLVMKEYDIDNKDGVVFEIVKKIARKEDRRGKGHRSVLMMIYN